MESTQERPPGYNDAAAAPATKINWPSVPSHEPEKSADVTLPDIQTALSADLAHVASPKSDCSLPRIDPGKVWKEDTSMTSPIGSVVSADERPRDEREAAETLALFSNSGEWDNIQRGVGDGGPDCASGARSSRSQSMNGAPAGSDMEGKEPILELVSQVHPWVGGTINASVSAYTTTKYYSPRIVQYGVNLVERNVASVGRYTGIEDNIRRRLEDRRPGDLERNAGSAMEIDGQDNAVVRLGRDGEQLPAYGASRPPSYREEESPAANDRTNGVATRDRPNANRSWSSQVFVTTSGLSVALSTASRQSLRWCLRMLSDQIGNVKQLTEALAILLRDYEETRQRTNTDSAMEKGQKRPPTPERDEGARSLAEKIRKTADDIWQAIRNVTNGISQYAGGALPENARQFVRVQLLSLPARWHLISQSRSSESDTSLRAQRMIDFAGQGLDMMSEVSSVLQATLESAEKWLAAVGRRDQQEDTTMQDADTPSHNEKQAPQQPESQLEKS